MTTHGVPEAKALSTCLRFFDHVGKNNPADIIEVDGIESVGDVKYQIHVMDFTGVAYSADELHGVEGMKIPG